MWSWKQRCSSTLFHCIPLCRHNSYKISIVIIGNYSKITEEVVSFEYWFPLFPVWFIWLLFTNLTFNDDCLKISSPYFWKFSHHLSQVWAVPSPHGMKSKNFFPATQILHNLRGTPLSLWSSCLWISLSELTWFPFCGWSITNSWKVSLQGNLARCIFVETENSLEDITNPLILSQT